MKRILCFLISFVVILYVGSSFCYSGEENVTTQSGTSEIAKPVEPVSVEEKEKKVRYQEEGLAIAGAQVGTGVEERVIVGESTSFSSSVEKVYCLSFVKGADTVTTINHVWYYKDKEMVSVSLDVKSPAFRTWSYKTILPEWVGSWRVEIVDDAGEVLKIIGFEITESENPVAEEPIIKKSGELEETIETDEKKTE